MLNIFPRFDYCSFNIWIVRFPCISDQSWSHWNFFSIDWVIDGCRHSFGIGIIIFRTFGYMQLLEYDNSYSAEVGAMGWFFLQLVEVSKIWGQLEGQNGFNFLYFSSISPKQFVRQNRKQAEVFMSKYILQGSLGIILGNLVPPRGIKIH